MKRKFVSIFGGAALIFGMSAAPAQAMTGACLADYVSASIACGNDGTCAAEALAVYNVCMSQYIEQAPPDCDATPRAEGCTGSFG